MKIHPCALRMRVASSWRISRGVSVLFVDGLVDILHGTAVTGVFRVYIELRSTLLLGAVSWDSLDFSRTLRSSCKATMPLAGSMSQATSLSVVAWAQERRY